MREQVVQFGKNTVLTGVLTLPQGGDAGTAPAFIFLNAGILHRVGSCRLHVRTARALANAGFITLRFDFSGIGDSEPRKDSLGFEESAPEEVRDAMDYLTSKRGVSRFVLMGLCSGADMAHVTAVKDERVAGLVLLDAWAYRTRMYWLRHYGQRLLQSSVWRNWLRLRLWRIAARVDLRSAAQASDASVEYDVPKYVRRFPPRDAIEADLRVFVARQLRMLAIFTSGQEDVYNHEGQYRSAFGAVPLGDLLEEHFLAEADHIITGLQHQDHVIARVRGWGLSHFAPELGLASRLPSVAALSPPGRDSGGAVDRTLTVGT